MDITQPLRLNIPSSQPRVPDSALYQVGSGAGCTVNMAWYGWVRSLVLHFQMHGQRRARHCGVSVSVSLELVCEHVCSFSCSCGCTYAENMQLLGLEWWIRWGFGDLDCIDDGRKFGFGLWGYIWHCGWIWRSRTSIILDASVIW